MNLLNEIYLPTKKENAVCIFYDWCNIVKGDKETYEDWKAEKKSNHVEMFVPSELSSCALNAQSFVLRFRTDRKTKKSMKFYLKDDKQVETLAMLLEQCLGIGLKVTEYYSRFKPNNLIKD